MNISIVMGRAMLLTLLLAVTGCATSPTARLYVLEPIDAQATAMDKSDHDTAIVIGNVLLSERLQRKEITEHKELYRLDVLEFDRWGEPLEAGITRVLAENLSSLLDSYNVHIAPSAHKGDFLRIDLQIHEFGSTPNGAVVLQATCSLTTAENRTLTMQMRHSEARQNESVESLVAAMSVVLEKLAREIALTITRL